LQDLLEEKIKSSKSKLEDYFPEFVHYMVPPEAQQVSYTKEPYNLRDNHACARNKSVPS